MQATLPLFTLPPAEARQRVREIIAAHASANPASIAYLRERTGLNERAIKGIVSHLRKGGDPICSRKGAPGGYWWASTDQEIRATVGELAAQARDMFWTIGRMLGSEAMFDLLGQTRLDLQKKISDSGV
jgi:biotin operon repressor